ncbi:MAG: FAD-binding oxidoreductase [candidate division Zixibacteria bacterium]|nr:FAD-binding oxidoreductase [candidate division Zixibacteria bacterium]
MYNKADAVIIGGGIIGVAAAFYLARANYGRIILVEKEKFMGSWSTAKAAGGIRAQFDSKVNIQMSMVSEAELCRFKDDTGYDAAFDQVGYMFMLSRDEDIAHFKKAYELQRSLGLPVELLQPEDIPRLAPIVRIDDIKLATFCPDDGLGDPAQFLAGYEQAARRMGVEFALETEVTGLTVAGDKITEVVTNKGTIACGKVINAAGPFGGLIGKMVGSGIKMQPYKRQCVTTGELDFVPSNFPMVVDVASGLYTHKESKGLLLGWADKAMPPSFDISVDPDYTDNILERALDRLPKLETAEVANVWAGLYETTPDHRAIIGWEPQVEGLLHLTGFSGHGFMHAPAAGILAAELLTGKEPSIDITDLAPERFEKGELVHETNVI